MSKMPARSTRGFTLVELMVGMALGLFLVAVMGTIYVGSKSTFQSQESIARLQENGRFAMDTIATDLRMSGFRGCLGQSKGTTFTNTLDTTTAMLYDFSQSIWGTHYTGGAWSPAMGAPMAGIGPKTAGDVLVVRHPVGTGWALTGEMTDNNAALTITPTSTIKQGDILLVADCGGSAVTQATNASPGTAGSIQHQPGAAGVSPGVTTADLGRAFLQDASVWRMQTVIYYLADSNRRTGAVSLWSYTAPGSNLPTQQTELVTGVERMVVRYGIDTNGDGAADQFRTADGVADWNAVVSARVELLLVGPEGSVTTSAQPYVFDGVSTTPTDRRQRTVMSLVASLRNSVP
jgi:type IV pilus assembly protein PilW